MCAFWIRPGIAGLAVTKNEGIPIFYKVFEGNIADTRTLQKILLLFREHNIENALIVWDRGVSSDMNIRDALDTGFQVLCGLALKGNVREKANKIVSGENFNTIKHRIRLKSATFYTKKIQYSYKETNGNLFVCLNENQKQYLKEKRYDEIDKAMELLAKDEKIKKIAWNSVLTTHIGSYFSERVLIKTV